MNQEAMSTPEQVDGPAIAMPAIEPSTELVLVVQPAPSSPDPLAQALSLLGAVAGRARSVGEQAARSATNAVLDRTVPVLVQAVLDRVDLTQLILDRVDVDRVVAQANLEEIIDRLPLVDVANYIIDEINLPQIVRESTGGIAGDAVNLLRMQSIDVDQALTRFVDVVLRRRASQRSEPGATDADAPGPSANGNQSPGA
jgi:hypothetical protein